MKFLTHQRGREKISALILTFSLIFISFECLATQEVSILQLSPHDVTEKVLENNVQIQMAILNFKIAQAEIEGAFNDFDTRLVLSPSFKNDTKLPNSTLDNLVVHERTTAGSIGFKKKVVSGGTGELVYQELRVVTDSLLATLPDSSRSAVQVKWTQPLLEGFGTEVATTQSQKSRLKARRYWYELLQTIDEEILESQKNYWKLYAAYQRVKSDEEALVLARENHQEVSARYQAGYATSTDLQQSDAKTALAEATLYASQIKLETAESDLLVKMWNLKDNRTMVKLIPQTSEIMPRPTNMPTEVETKKTAQFLKSQTEIKQLEVDLKKAKNSLLPQLDLGLQYSLTGLGDHFSIAREQILKSQHDSWQVSLTLTFPFENFTARGETKRSQAALKTQEVKVQREEKTQQSNYLSSKRDFEKKLQTAQLMSERLKIETSLFAMKKKAFKAGSYSWKDFSKAMDSLSQVQSSWQEQVAHINQEWVELLALSGQLANKNVTTFLQRLKVGQ